MHYGTYASHTLLAVSGSYHILVVTALKYLAAVSPLKHYVVTKRLVLKIVLGVWIISTVFAVIPLAWHDNETSKSYRIIHTAVCLVAVFLFPYVFMVYAFIAMFRVITKRQRPSSVESNKLRKQKKNKSDRKCILVFAAMAIIFACCWFPYFIAMLLVAIEIGDFDFVLEAFIVIRYITSFANPLLYTFFKRDFWSALRNLLQNKRKFSFSYQKSQFEALNLTSRLRARSRVSNRGLVSLKGERQESNVIRDGNVTFGEEIFRTTRV